MVVSFVCFSWCFTAGRSTQINTCLCNAWNDCATALGRDLADPAEAKSATVLTANSTAARLPQQLPICGHSSHIHPRPPAAADAAFIRPRLPQRLSGRGPGRCCRQTASGVRV